MAEEFEGPVVVKRPTGQPPNFEVAKFDGDVGLDGTLKTTHVSAGGNISARGNVNGEVVNAGETVTAKNIQLERQETISGPAGTGVQLLQTVLQVPAKDTLGVMHLVAEGNISALGNLNAGVTVNTKHVRAEGNISALNNVNAKNMQVEEDIKLSNSDCAEEFDLEDSFKG